MDSEPRMIAIDDDFIVSYTKIPINQFFDNLKTHGVESISLENNYDCNDEYTFKMFRQETSSKVSNRVESNKKKMISHIAYTLWLEDKTKAYTIIQPYDGSCRGGYGLLVDE